MNELYKKAEDREQMEFRTHKNSASCPGWTPPSTSNPTLPAPKEPPFASPSPSLLMTQHHSLECARKHLRKHLPPVRSSESTSKDLASSCTLVSQLNQEGSYKTQSKTEAMYFLVTKKTEAELHIQTRQTAKEFDLMDKED